MSLLRQKKMLAVFFAGAVFALCTEPLQVRASENVLPSAGIAALLEARLSTEEYIQAARDAQGACWGYTNVGIANVENYLNVRETPSLKGRLVGKMPKNSACEVLEMLDGWAHITSGEVEGYVSLDYLLTGPEAIMKAADIVHTVAVVNVDGLNVREQADADSGVLTQVPQGEELDYLETLEEWIKVSLDGEEAYVSAEYVTVKDKLDTAVTMSELLYGVGVSDARVELVELAKGCLGNPYVWGGTSLTKGADCSGFVLTLYKKFNVTLSHSARAQSKEGTKITYSEIQPGDLIFYANSKGTINHVAVYIGDGQVIHASSPKTGIKISKYNYRTPVKYVSIFKD